MEVYRTPPDESGQRWRVEIDADGRVRVYRLVVGAVSGAPLRRPRTVNELGGWLVSLGLGVDDLEKI
jgi:hypothetical protein